MSNSSPSWATEEFDQLQWHDAMIHALAVTSEPWELLLDIDYILEWICPVPPESKFQFKVTPATLIFENAGNVIINIDLNSSDRITIREIRRSDPRKPNGVNLVWTGPSSATKVRSPSWPQVFTNSFVVL